MHGEAKKYDEALAVKDTAMVSESVRDLGSHRVSIFPDASVF